MKKWMMLLALCLMMTFSAAAQAEGYYSLGDRMEDFEVTLSDGTRTSLYGLLEEKDAVLINFWATWCDPCRMEFPYMQEAYDLMSDEIGILALSEEPADTDADILALKKELGLDTLPMGRDAGGVSQRFSHSGIPCSVMVDKNGVICFQKSGSITETDKFIRLFSVFTAEDYDEPVLLDRIPAPKPDVEIPATGELAAALGLDESRITLKEHADESVWPFLPDEEGARASNGAAAGAYAEFTVCVTAQAGDVLVFEYASSCEVVREGLFVLDESGRVLMNYGGEKDWTQAHLLLNEGEQELTFRFEHSEWAKADAQMKLRNLRVVSAEEAAQIEAANPPVRTLAGNEMTIEIAQGEVAAAWLGEVGVPEGRGGASVLTGGELVLRVRIGADVDEEKVGLYDGEKCFLLTDLEKDEQGYLLSPAQKSGLYQLGVYESVVEMAEGQTASAWINLFLSEAALDDYVKELEAYYMSVYSVKVDLEWGYEEAEQAALPEGMAEYRVVVVDEAGRPIEGVMMQFCDENTCQVVGTDAEGVASLVNAKYPYEVHVLIANGYVVEAKNHIMPVEGGELKITLRRQ